MKLKRILKVHDDVNGHELWDLSDNEAMLKFATTVYNNYEAGDERTISVVERTEKEWEEICSGDDSE